MLYQRTTSFSPDNKYFAYFSSDDKLLVWETFSNTAVIDCKLDSCVYGSCTSLLWIPAQHKQHSPKKARVTRSQFYENQLLALGTNEGDIILYNITTKNLYSHLRGRHSDSINDLCFCIETNSFFTCSSDKSIAIWDIASGKQKSKWTADDAPVCSICVLDANNLLSANTSILWWNISEKTILKKFYGHSTEIFKILPVNADLSLKSCYFISAAVGSTTINAWSLNSSDCQVPVACFIPSSQPQAIDMSTVSSKDKPLILTVITTEGQFNLFEHTLNGNVIQPLHPKTILTITPEPNCQEPVTASVISTKLSSDSESCIIACGSSKDTMIFKHIRIKKPPEDSCDENSSSNEILSENRLSPVKVGKNISINGVKSPEKNLKVVGLKDVTTGCSQKKNGSSPGSVTETSTQKFPVPSCKLFVDDARHVSKSTRDIDTTDPASCVGMLFTGLKTHDKDLIDIVFHSDDKELICNCVKNLPSHSLRHVLEELHRRLLCNQRSSPTLRKWLREILRIHLKYLTESQDTSEILSCIKEFVEAKRIQETVSKMSTLRGLLNLQVQITSSDESDSDSEESIEL